MIREYKLYYTLRRSIYRLRNLEEEEEEIYEENEINCTLINDTNTNNIHYYECKNDVGINNKSLIQEIIIDSDEISGIHEGNNDIVETDEKIINGKLVNCSTPEIVEIYKKNNIANLTINDHNINDCSDRGTFTLKGLVTNNEVSKDGEEIINYINPDSGALCKYYRTEKNKNMSLECQNKNEFSDQSIIVGNQFINETIFLNKFVIEEPVSCEVGSLSYKEADDINADNYANKYFSKTGSSGGLSGGAIAGIVIICCLVVISIGVLIALMKNGYFVTSKSRQDSSIPPITNSSANII